MLEYVVGERDTLPIADLARVAVGRTTGEAAATACAHLPGWLLASRDHDLIEVLLEAGAVERRHAFVMRATLDTETTAEPGDVPDVVPLPEVAALYPSWRRAYPLGHPDYEPGTDDDVIARCFAHVDTPEYRAVLHRSSGAVLTDGAVMAAIVVDLRPEPSPYGGPWISDIWVDPQYAGQGIGARLIGRAKHLLAEDGYTTLGLAVTHGNPARRVYERVGFTPALESWTVVLPV